MFTEILNSVRDLATIAVIVYVLIKSGPLTLAAKSFLSRATQHFEFMERTAQTVESNHLKHIQAALETLVENRKK